jgi:cytochrome c-type biogenesis protein CcmH/NrfF
MALWAFPFALLVGVGALIGLGRFKQRKRDLTPVPDDRSQDDA